MIGQSGILCFRRFSEHDRPASAPTFSDNSKFPNFHICPLLVGQNNLLNPIKFLGGQSSCCNCHVAAVIGSHCVRNTLEILHTFPTSFPVNCTFTPWISVVPRITPLAFVVYCFASIAASTAA